MTRQKWGAGLSAAAGIVLAVAPFVLGYYTLSDVAMYEAVCVGVLIAALGLWSAWSTTAPDYLDYLVALLGAWSVAAPFVWGYAPTLHVARNTDVVLGAVVALIALAGHFNVSPDTRRRATAQ
jgi:hypothetical protein